MSGYIRYKYDNKTVGEYTVSTTIAGATKSKTLRIKQFCTGGILIKYLDHNGQYRFYAFNERFKKTDTPKLIGSTNSTINELLTAQGSKKNIGYTNERKINAFADNIPQDEMDLLADLYTSPRVLLYIGSGTDDIKDWILVTVKDKNNLLKKSKGSFYSMELEITLPETYHIRMA